MKLHLIKEKTNRNYVLRNARSKVSFEDWLSKATRSDWNSADDIKYTFNSASILGKGTYRVVFDVGGNNYRMSCKYGFGETEVHLFVCWIGTHAEYDELCKQNKQYTVIEY